MQQQPNQPSTPDPAYNNLATDTTSTNASENPPIASNTAQAIWYYEDNGERKGAVTEAEISQLLRSGILTTQSGVWRKGFADWMALDKTELKQYLDDSVPPPLTGEHVNNTIVWVLAFAPLIGTFLEYMLAGMLHSSDARANAAVDSGHYIFVTIGLNIALCFLDASRLEKAGVQTEKFKGFVWLVPVYLFQRAKVLKHNLAYFIVWIVCFAVTLV